MVLLRQFTLAISAAVAALGSLLFIGWNYFYRRRLPVCESGPRRPAARQVCRERQVLVLGLDGAGKSSVLRCLSGAGVSRGSGPTWGFNTPTTAHPHSGCVRFTVTVTVTDQRVRYS
ncbi:ADP-ribosylation factor-like protein 10 [Acipenser ruthenus]|uniref:ADP-ribosylation factor-like protein 10 n=1 Tax=Acipenser ruthenus TaxID=7906 RepID=A0A444UAZ8_ACIRT|nr:ADP-ribosylation factor-like protein 10 [Acipenser ruthenus]